MRTTLSLASALICQSLSGQCTATYSDGSVDGANTTFTAWASVTDYYNAFPCTPAWGSFSHTYHARVSIVSPLGRVASNYSTSSQYGGGGTAYASTSLVIVEDGDYDVEEEDTIDCTVAGAAFFAATRRSPMFAVGKVRTVYGFDTPFGGCGYHKRCSPSKNHWAGDSYMGMPLNKSASPGQPPTECWFFVSKFHRFVKVRNYKTYWPITNDMGQSWVGHDDWLECDGPMP